MHWAEIEDESDHKHGDDKLHRSKELNEETTEDLDMVVAVGAILVSETSKLTRPEDSGVDEHEEQSPHLAKIEGSDEQDGSDSPLKPSLGLVEIVSRNATSNDDEDDIQSADMKGETSGSLTGHLALNECWRARILGSDAPQQQDDTGVPDPNLDQEGGTTPETCQALLHVTEVASGATCIGEGEDDTGQGSMEAEMS
ncbi:hypothetical protein R1sor_022879 [Riccia sorocarpa]|uniref:Uncharacterized protein n=1 Tax=Riccia sorocarpa TaxID=122646 RepID=A0ABD3GL52_9MARC